MEIIRESKGVAEDYAPLVLDLYDKKNGNLEPVNNALEKLAKDAAHLKEKQDKQEILLSYKSDPFPDEVYSIDSTTGDREKLTDNITKQAIEILKKNDLRFCVLTEKAENALQYLELLNGYRNARYGLNLLSNSNGNRLNMGEPPLFFRIESLKEANKLGIKTWVDLDPVIDPDQALDLIKKLHPYVNHWKIGKLNNGESDVDQLKFREDVIELLGSLAAVYDLKKNLKNIKEPKEKNTPKFVPTLVAENAKAKKAEETGPWTDGVIPTRRGNRNILVIAPHGHPSDDKGTYQLARQLADELDCYAVVNEKYRKPKNAGLKAPSLRKWAADLNCWSHIKKFKKLQKQFLEPIDTYKKEILSKSNTLLILHIHGIGDANRGLVAQLLPEFKAKPEDLHLLFGYGQHRNNDANLITTKIDKLLKPLMTELHKNGVKSAIAPTQHILDKDGIKQWYCGNHKKKLNQKLCSPRDKIQSLQLEFKDGGFRDEPENIKEATLKISKALKEFLEVEDKDQNQNAAVPETAASKKHKIYTDFMAIIQRNSESAMLEAGKYLFKTFYKNEIEAAKDDKKKEPLNSLHEYIQDLHGNDPVAPKKSWIYNSVKLAVEYKELKAYLKDDFHMYGNGLNLSQKVLLFTENDLEKKIQIIRETAEFIKESGKPLTFVKFKNRFKASRSKQKQNGTRKPSLLSIISKPEKLFTDEMSNLLTPEALNQLPSSKLEKLRAEAKNSIAKIETKMKLEIDYVKRYRELIDAIKNTSQRESEEHSPVPNPQKKALIHDNEGNGDL